MWQMLWIVGVVFALGVWAIFPFARWLQRRELRNAWQSFRRQREVLEAKFFEIASQSGKPRGLIWKECDWQNRVRLVRDRQSHQLAAFVGVEIHFAAIEGGDMEDVAAVGTVRDATAVFHYQDGAWGTGGRVLFNMDPDVSLEKLHSQFEPLEELTA